MQQQGNQSAQQSGMQQQQPGMQQQPGTQSGMQQQPQQPQQPGMQQQGNQPVQQPGMQQQQPGMQQQGNQPGQQSGMQQQGNQPGQQPGASTDSNVKAHGEVGETGAGMERAPVPNGHSEVDSDPFRHQGDVALNQQQPNQEDSNPTWEPGVGARGDGDGNAEEDESYEDRKIAELSETDNEIQKINKEIKARQKEITDMRARLKNLNESRSQIVTDLENYRDELDKELDEDSHDQNDDTAGSPGEDAASGSAPPAVKAEETSTAEEAAPAELSIGQNSIGEPVGTAEAPAPTGVALLPEVPGTTPANPVVEPVATRERSATEESGRRTPEGENEVDGVPKKGEDKGKGDDKSKVDDDVKKAMSKHVEMFSMRSGKKKDGSDSAIPSTAPPQAPGGVLQGPSGTMGYGPDGSSQAPPMGNFPPGNGESILLNISNTSSVES